MDATTIAQHSPDRRGRLLKAAVVVPDLIISGLITFVLLAALPPAVALGFVAAMLVMSIVVASGRAEGLAVRILHAARRPTVLEARRIAGPVRLVAVRSGLADLRVVIGRCDEPATAAGHRHVILHPEVVDAHRAGRITEAEVAALLAHGVGRLRLGQPRLDLLVVLWTLPWDFLRGLVLAVGYHLAWVPLGRLAWQTRFVVGALAVVLEAHAGRWPSPIIITVFIGLSYVMPRTRHAWHRHVTVTADRQTAELGFAWPLTQFLHRLHQADQIVTDSTYSPLTRESASWPASRELPPA